MKKYFFVIILSLISFCFAEVKYIDLYEERVIEKRIIKHDNRVQLISKTCICDTAEEVSDLLGFKYWNNRSYIIEKGKVEKASDIPDDDCYYVIPTRYKNEKFFVRIYKLSAVSTDYICYEVKTKKIKDPVIEAREKYSMF